MRVRVVLQCTRLGVAVVVSEEVAETPPEKGARPPHVALDRLPYGRAAGCLREEGEGHRIFQNPQIITCNHTLNSHPANYVHVVDMGLLLICLVLIALVLVAFIALAIALPHRDSRQKRAHEVHHWIEKLSPAERKRHADRRVVAIVNPHGGGGTALATYETVLAPMCEALGIVTDLRRSWQNGPSSDKRGPTR